LQFWKFPLRFIVALDSHRSVLIKALRLEPETEPPDPQAFALSRRLIPHQLPGATLIELIKSQLPADALLISRDSSLSVAKRRN